MKRSQINQAYREAKDCFQRHHWALPANAKWDITDFGLDDFDRFGLILVNLGARSTTLTFATVQMSAGDCYPSAGSLTVVRTDITLVVTMDADTASTGAVTVSVAGRDVERTLPAYGTCPSA